MTSASTDPSHAAWSGHGVDVVTLCASGSGANLEAAWLYP
jgi:hypothetical protein